MASALVRIKTAVDSNGLVKANKDAEGLMKSLKKLSTAGWIGATVAVAKKAAEALSSCKKAYLEAEGAGSAYAKASDEMSKATERLKKAIGGSLIAGNSGTMLTSLSGALNKVANAIEESNRKKNLITETQNSSYGLNKSEAELFNDYVSALRIQQDTENEILLNYGGIENATKDILNRLEKDKDRVNQVFEAYTNVRDNKPAATDKRGAVTKSASSYDEYFAQYSNPKLLETAYALNDATKQLEEYNKLLKSDRTDSDIINYLKSTNKEFDSILSQRDYLRDKVIPSGGNAGAAATDINKILQPYINTMINNVRSSLPEIITESTTKAVDNSALVEWERKQNEEGAKRRALLEEQKRLLEENLEAVKQSALSGLGQLGTLIQGDWWGLLADFVGQLVTRLNEISPDMDIITNFVTVLVSALDPVLEIIAKVLPLITEALKSIYGFIYTIASVIKALFNSVVYGFKWVVAAITFDKKGRKEAENYISASWQAITTDNIQAAIDKAFSTSYGSSSSKGSGSASYTAARDLYITINYNSSYVNGDARAIAINLRDEIRAAEAMGY